jgi:hypothetical protein
VPALTAAVFFGTTPAIPSSVEPAREPPLIAERLPRVVHHGGPFLRRPEITTVTFRGDDPELVARLETFGRWVTRSEWWGQVSDGYCAPAGNCIGPGGAGRAVRLARRVPGRVRDVDVERWLAEQANKRGALEGLGQDALVLVYLPGGVTLSDAFQRQYCGPGPRAYHRLLRRGAVSFPYAVIARCHGEAETTATASHEVLEAATNPDPSRPGFRLRSDTTQVAFAFHGPEPVDPCGLLNRDRHRAMEGGFTVQRAWSNRAAARGGDPCVPGVAERAYVALVPRQPVVRLTSPGAKATVMLDAVADRPVPGWTVEAVDLTAEGESGDYVEARLDRSNVVNGEVAVLTLRVLRVPRRQTTVVGIVSRLGSESHLWPIAVSMR